MESFKCQLLISLLLSFRYSSCQQQQQQQQPSTYNQPNPNKVQLEDIERDNLKAAQQPPPSASNQAAQSQQYVPYTSQDQLLFSLQPQQISALYAAAAQQPTSALYPVQQPSSVLYTPPQQQHQQLIYQPYYQQTQPQPQQYSFVDFGGLPLYPGLYPYFMPQTTPQSGDYYKSLQSTKTTQAASAGTKSINGGGAQIPVSNYLLSNPVPQTYYQPVAYTQSSSPYYSYNSYYQVQTPQKSVYSSGIKSTTPSAPSKGKDEPFVPISGGNYRLEYSGNNDVNSNNYSKLRG